MSGASTKRMLDAYIEQSPTPGFLTGFFQSPARNHHNSEEVVIDVRRSGRDVAIVITDITTGRRISENSLYTSHTLKPPIYDEEFGLVVWDTMKRAPGEDPFQNPSFLANARREMELGFHEAEQRIIRAIELQASQVLQSGTLDLKNKDGTTIYNVDFKPKTAHFPTVGNDWGAAGATPILDLAGVADKIRLNGKTRARYGIFGADALDKFLSDDDVFKRLDNRRMNRGSIDAPEERQGGYYHGTITVGNDNLEIWSYDESYTDPATGDDTPYVDPDNVIVIGNNVRLDLSFGAIPQLLPPDPRLAPIAMGRIRNDRLDLTTNVWCTPDGRQLRASCGTRPLCIPTQIDGIACLTTKA